MHPNLTVYLGTNMKHDTIAVILIILFTLPCYAQTNKDIDNEAKFTFQPEETNSEIKDLKIDISDIVENLEKMTNIYLDCEYDLTCAYKKAEEFAKNEPNEISELFYKNLQVNQKRIEFEHQYCTTDDIKMYKKIFTQCEREAIASLKKTNANDSAKRIELTQTCFMPKAEELARQGNLYAQIKLLEYAQTSDKSNIDKWQKEIDNNKNKTQYEIYLKCSSYKDWIQ